MGYIIDTFLRPLGNQDTSIQIYDVNEIIRHTINPFSISRTNVSNNILQIQLKNQTSINLDFRSSNESKIALQKLQEQIDVLKTKTPYSIDKNIENYIKNLLNNRDDIAGNGLSYSNGVLNIIGGTGIGIGSDNVYIKYDPTTLQIDINGNLSVSQTVGGIKELNISNGLTGSNLNGPTASINLDYDKVSKNLSGAGLTTSNNQLNLNIGTGLTISNNQLQIINGSSMIIGSGSANYLTKFNGTYSITKSKILDLNNTIFINYEGRFGLDGNTQFSVQRAQTQIDMVLGNPDAFQPNKIWSDNSTSGLEVLSKGYLSFKVGNSYIESLKISNTGDLIIGKTPSMGAIGDYFLVRDSLGNIKQVLNQGSLIENLIIDGVVDKAPSQNAVYDALQTKADLIGATFTGAITATNLTGTNSGDQDLSGLMVKNNNGSDIQNIMTFRQNLGIDKLTTFDDIDYNILSTDKVVVTNIVFTQPRTLTLPNPNEVNAGYEIIVADIIGAITTTNTLSILGTINGTSSILNAEKYSVNRFISNGVDKWSYDNTNDLLFVNSFSDLPLVGNNDMLYIAKDTNIIYRWNGVIYTEMVSKNIIEVTYSELLALKDSSTLIVGQTYLLTDYETTYYMPETLDLISSGVIEPLFISAVDVNKLHNECRSKLYPQDIIYYEITGDLQNGLGTEGFTKGKIYRRIDTIRNNDIGTDWRHIKYRRYKLDVNNVYTIGNNYDVGDVVLDGSDIWINTEVDTISQILDTTKWFKFPFTNDEYISFGLNGVYFNSLSGVIIPCNIDFYQDYYMFDMSLYDGGWINNNTITYQSLNNSVFFNIVRDNKITKTFKNNTISSLYSSHIDIPFTTNFMYAMASVTMINTTTNALETGFGGNIIGGEFSENVIKGRFTNTSICGNRVKLSNFGKDFINNIILNANVYKTDFDDICYSNKLIGDIVYCNVGTEFSSNIIKCSMYQINIGISFKFHYIDNITYLKNWTIGNEIIGPLSFPMIDGDIYSPTLYKSNGLYLVKYQDEFGDIIIEYIV